ncbi:TVP38/TMEM64 family protein [Pluralibacter gergoviae]|uniref:TVP38/TMEM64 family protein n=1 Tax=Pluralibacter gergoviae TaxID=61647 RepID=UPI0028825E57|nr:TVP38/TMEM64 family protein [Pluralibacter gergoviae]ELG9927716.1 TVP38/TMEM64 family protein [Pluralibacter gergoviae]ELK5593293.1 TVP38/TMEM64 family protein [Pluralibacter gergoviae]MDU4003245.1 TVP38/TMEM64 family protein [Pluralibacter gergoviae]MDU4434556.1 TVP38/TMEM64 family protein [Pluralibacter gergoviae]
MNRRKYALLALLAALIITGCLLMPREMLTLSALQSWQHDAALWHAQRPLSAALIYFIIYATAAALSVPGATALTLLGGAIFPFWQAVVLVSFASTLGALLAMLASRYLFTGWVSQRFPRQMATVNAGMAKDGAFYLFALRLMPLFPFFVVNLLAGVTRIGLLRYWWVSQLGMLPATLVYLNAGRQLGQLTSLSGILSPGILLAFVLIGLLPLASRWLTERLQHR